MKRSRFCEEQIIDVLKEQEAGMATADVCRRHGISWVAFFKISLSSRSIRFFRRSRSFSMTRSDSGTSPDLLGRYIDTHILRDDLPMPRSVATCSWVNPLVSAIRAASRLNSSLCTFISSVPLSELYTIK